MVVNPSISFDLVRSSHSILLMLTIKVLNPFLSLDVVNDANQVSEPMEETISLCGNHHNAAQEHGYEMSTLL